MEIESPKRTKKGAKNQVTSINSSSFTESQPFISAQAISSHYFQPPHPYTNANFIKRGFFVWVLPLLRYGARQTVEKDDIWDIRKCDSAEHQCDKLSVVWKDYKPRRDIKYPLINAIIKAYKSRIYLATFFNLITAVLAFSGPMAIKWLGNWMAGNEAMWIGYAIVFGLFIAKLLQSVFSHQAAFLQTLLGINIANSVSTLIYQKSIVLTPASQNNYQHGEIVNLLQVDISKIQFFFDYFSGVIIAFVQCTLGMWLLFDFLGVSFLGGFGVIVLMTAANYFNGMIASRIQKRLMKKRDARMKATTELFNAIKIIKLFSWEQKFIKKVEDLRETELQDQRKAFYCSIFSISFLWVTPMLISTTTFAFYTMVAHEDLTPMTVFASLALFNIMQEPIRSLPRMIVAIVQNLVSLRRIQNFLRCQELPDSNIEFGNIDPGSKIAVQIDNGWFSWGYARREDDIEEEQEKRKRQNSRTFRQRVSSVGSFFSRRRSRNDPENDLGISRQALMSSAYGEITDDNSALLDDGDDPIVKCKPVLHDINLSINKGEFIAVVGQVGSGKSSLMSAIIGELEILNDSTKKSEYMDDPFRGNYYNDGDCRVRVDGAISYVSQKAWIMNDTIKANILFGKQFDESRYSIAVKFSCLAPDLDILPKGDQTQIGERGITLSGGQKTRVALARAIYADTDIILLDDTLSAVDNHVGKQIFNDCFCGIFGRKTRVLITHGIHYLPSVDRVLVMDGGRIVQSGTHDELSQQEGGLFQEMLEVHFRFTSQNQNQDQGSTEATEETEEDHEDDINEDFEDDVAPELIRKISIMSSQSEDEVAKMLTPKKKKKKPVKETGNLMLEEDRETGEVSKKVYKDHIKYNGGYIYAFLVLFVMAIFTGLKIASDFWLSYWSDQSEENQKDHVHFYLLIYGMFALSSGIFVFFRVLILTMRAVKCSRILHSEMIQCLTRAPLNLFFDRTPTGRLLNRLSKDLNIVDAMICFILGNASSRGYQVVAVFIVIAVPLPWMLVTVPMFLWIAVKINRFYLETNRELTRLESISRSPIVNFFAETLNGTSVIRAFKKQKDFDRQNKSRIDENVKINFALAATGEWLGISLEFISNIILVITCVFFVTMRGSYDAAIVTLVLSYVILLQDCIFWFMRSASLLETKMVSVERCHAYTRVQPEAPLEILQNRPSASWPEEGKIVFHAYSVRYRPETELVLKNIDCVINGGEKVGIVGRTGAGKSTITLALFRIIEPDRGTIVIDGVDTSKIGLRDLRKHLSIIPQDPILFSGSLRFNIDPFDEFSDAEVWTALEKACLKETTLQWDNGLQFNIKDSGENLSVGERQLICIARAFVKRSKLVVVDEATASIDSATDSLIYDAMKTHFKNSTVLTIAHRIHTVIENDKIMVLERGQLLEFAPPKELLKDENSMFSHLVKKAH
eukprot:CAMPEP_0114996004 /NCGR_PEP_ID=MMETSP0216-20121206/14061_1 /TAXON_ID=223996 /ORGANISM="Protocruzia adherens, Strain Boccale" /LENGTH=1423 /DNA_ID=CAMNT_0002360143 /DNA_START=156 /DNA_END=4427 /DNA_ORIENTATION=+